MRDMKGYMYIPKREKEKIKGFKILDEYEEFYLCGKYDDHGKLLYKECFTKFDIDGVQNEKKCRGNHSQYKF